MKFLRFITIITLITACKNDESKFVLNENYRSEIKTFFNDKMEERQNDYLQLVALHKLDTGENTFGKNDTNNLILKIDALPESIGNITKKGDSISFNAFENVVVKTNNDSLISKIYLKLNKYGSSQKMHHNQLSWQVITRSNQQYLRVWDSKNPAIETFKGFEKFDLNNNFIFEGEFSYYDQEKSEVVKAKVDGKRSINFIGNVSFIYDNKTYMLEVGADGFTMVGDITNGDTTYGGGRYCYLDLPKQNGLVKVDFNKLYNPPCAFSEYTTCLYPPRQNQLPFKVLAGETIIFN